MNLSRHADSDWETVQGQSIPNAVAGRIRNRWPGKDLAKLLGRFARPLDTMNIYTHSVLYQYKCTCSKQVPQQASIATGKRFRHRIIGFDFVPVSLTGLE
jgi:hypothetical protein